MSKATRTLFILTLCLGGFLAAGCRNGGSGKTSSDRTFEDYVTERDTQAVESLVNRFLYFVEQGDYMGAASILYKNTPQHLKVPEPLDNDEMRNVATMLEQLQPVGHRIDYIKFSQAHRNEVRVSLILREATADAPEVATSLTFNPVDAIDVWYLCLFDLSTNDRSIVDVRDRDSLSDRFSQHASQPGMAPR